jgi:xylulokinase
LNGLELILGGREADVILVTGGGARSEAWRQLLADATGALIRVPAEAEAGCLGAAMQAIYAYGHFAGRPESFTEIADRCVRFEESNTAVPIAERREAYRQAMETYRLQLAALYAVKF